MAAGKPSPAVLEYALLSTAGELRRVHGRAVRCASKIPSEVGPEEGLILLIPGEPAAELAAAARSAGFRLEASPPGPEGYRVVVRSAPFRVLVHGSDPEGVWRGACAWLNSIGSGVAGQAEAPVGEISGRQELAFRFTRPIQAGPFISIDQAIPSLDWWARWGMNVTRGDSCPIELLPAFTEQAHRRGLRVLGGLGVRNLCAADDRQVAEKVAEFERLMAAGCDGVSVLWDDLPHSRPAGHCEQCRKRFGPDSLPREIVQVLEALCAAAAKSPSSQRPLIVWCPSHYSANRYPEMSDEAFFTAVAVSAAVREGTWMYYCELPPERLVMLDRLGLTRRVWWYNGLRSMYQNCNRWPTAPAMKLNLGERGTLSQEGFPPLESGWKMGVGFGVDGDLLGASPETHGFLRALPDRYQGFYPCTANRPYHAAMAGTFSTAPSRFSQDQADQAVFRAMFGPGSGQPAREWNQLYDRLQVWVARQPASAPAGGRLAPPREWLDRWLALGQQLDTLAARGRHLLPADLLESTLQEMHAAQTNLLSLVGQPAR